MVGPGPLRGELEIESPLFAGGEAFAAFFVSQGEVQVRVGKRWGKIDGAEKMLDRFVGVAELLDALTYFFNIMHDYESSIVKGYVQQAMKQAKVAIDTATGRAA